MQHVKLYLLNDSECLHEETQDGECVALVHIVLPDLNVFTFLDFVTEQEDLVSSEHRATRLVHPRDLQVGGVRRLCNRNKQEAEDGQTESLTQVEGFKYSVTSKKFDHPNTFKQK